MKNFPRSNTVLQLLFGLWWVVYTLLASEQTISQAAYKDQPAQVVFSTYLGGKGYDEIRDVAIDGDGYIYIAGSTDSIDLKPTNQFLLPEGRKSMNVMVARYSSDGVMNWLTIIGGPNHDRAYAIELEKDGTILVAGRAGDGMPTTSGVIQPKFGGDSAPSKLYGPQDGFIARLSADGSELQWLTYFGGYDQSIIRDIAVDQTGNVLLAMNSVSKPNPHITRNAFQSKIAGGRDGLIAKITPDGKHVLWATYLGGTGDNDFSTPSIRVDSAGNIFGMGGTNSKDMPALKNAFDQTLGGGIDLYLVKFSSSGKFIFGTYMGGSRQEGAETHELALNPEGHPIVSTGTRSPDFPVTSGVYQPSFGSKTNDPKENDGFVSIVSSDGSQLLASTFIGGIESEFTQGIWINALGQILISGETSSRNFPLSSNAIQKKYGGDEDCFVSLFSPDLKKLVFSTYFGGTKFDRCRSNTIDAEGNLIMVGVTSSGNFPTMNAFEDKYRGGEQDGFIIKFAIQP